MSCGATLWTWEPRGLEAVERLTLSAMADFASPKCEVNASFETLCEQTELEPVVVEPALNNLQLGDLIKITLLGSAYAWIRTDWPIESMVGSPPT
jgi:hypothetical protein